MQSLVVFERLPSGRSVANLTIFIGHVAMVFRNSDSHEQRRNPEWRRGDLRVSH